VLDFIDVKQNTDEWLSLRAGKLTSSKLGVVMANFGKSFGETAKKYAVNIALEQVTGNVINNNYSNEHMQRGHTQEPIARSIYETENFCEVTNGGFFNSAFIGCSPDGLVSDNGVLEIKSVISTTQFATLKRQALDPVYKWQCVGNMKFTGRDWIDFVSYCAEFPEENRIFVHRLRREEYEKEYDMIDSRIEEFLSLVVKTKNIILNSNYSV